MIDPDVPWSCTTCGACMEQCPVDIEHVDHIVDMRRYQVLVESSFPSEAGTMLKNLENKGNPWDMNADARLDWRDGLDFPVPVVGEDAADLSQVEYLYWVGCAGALDDRTKKTTRAFAELLHTAEVSFAILRPGEAAPETRPGGWATSSCSRCSPRPTSRPSTRPSVTPTAPRSGRPRRSWPPARTVSTRWPTSTRSSAATTR